MAEQNNNFVENQDNQFFREEAIRPIEETDYYRKNCRYIFGLTVVVTYLDFCSRNYPSSNEIQTATEKLIDGECSLDSNKNLKGFKPMIRSTGRQSTSFQSLAVKICILKIVPLKASLD